VKLTVKISPNICGSEGSLPCSERPTALIPIFSKINLVNFTLHLIKIHFNIIFPSTPAYSKWFIPFRYCDQNVYTYLVSLINNICSMQLITLRLTQNWFLQAIILFLLFFMSIGWVNISELRQLTGLLHIPRWYMSMEKRWNDTDTGAVEWPNNREYTGLAFSFDTILLSLDYRRGQACPRCRSFVSKLKVSTV
jgi:hypothetical protein